VLFLAGVADAGAVAGNCAGHCFRCHRGVVPCRFNRGLVWRTPGDAAAYHPWRGGAEPAASGGGERFHWPWHRFADLSLAEIAPATGDGLIWRAEQCRARFLPVNVFYSRRYRATLPGYFK